MKIRILENSIRLRLSQSEVRELEAKGSVLQAIHFGPASVPHLDYAVQKTASKTIQATYEAHKITVHLPDTMVQQWAGSNTVSISGEMPIDDTLRLKILVEKDFKCLTDRVDEDETDLFPHPKESNVKC